MRCCQLAYMQCPSPIANMAANANQWTQPQYHVHTTFRAHIHPPAAKHITNTNACLWAQPTSKPVWQTGARPGVTWPPAANSGPEMPTLCPAAVTLRGASPHSPAAGRWRVPPGPRSPRRRGTQSCCRTGGGQARGPGGGGAIGGVCGFTPSAPPSVS
jgi:hypothetical protein